ncbi:MAG: polysaccharide biosynthesis tyrosine autokinase [Chitinophagaceae bacterium]
MEPDFDLTVKNKEDNNFRSIWSRFLPYWPLLIILIALCVSGAWLYLQYQTPLYEAKATILIKDEKKGVDESKGVEPLNQFEGTKIVENEIEVITSRSLMTEVVKKLGLYAPVYVDGKWRPIPAYDFSPVKVELQNPDALKETPRVSFWYNAEASKVIIGVDSFPVDKWVASKYGMIRFAKRKEITDSTANNNSVSYYFALINPRKVTGAIAKKLEATSSNKLSTVIDLRVQNEVPSLSEDILNTLISSYDRAAIKDRNLLADSTLSFLDERLKRVSHELDSIEKRTQNYRSDQNAVDISSQGKLFLENVSANDQKVSEMNMQLAVLDEVEKYVQSKDLSSEIAPSALVVNDPLLAKRLDALYAAQAEYEKLKKNTAENNQLIVSIVSQIERIKPSILESIRNQKKSLEAGKNNLLSTNSKYNSMLQAVPQKERDLIEFSRAQTLKSNLYNYLAQKREETALSHSSIIPNSRLVDQAEASFEPVSPDKKSIYVVAVGLAFALFIGCMALVGLFNSTLSYVQEIEKFTTVPVIAEIPNGKRKKPLVISEGETTFIAEQFRKLRTSLGYLGIAGKRKKILVTSAIPGEGKSFISANLGLSLAMAGKKVIILEFDMVNPVLADKFDVSIDRGMESYLSGEAEPEEVIRRTAVSENLFILPAGDTPTNPSELILSGLTEKLLEYAENIFDYVIVDTAPVALRSDAYVLSKFCDATLYIVRHKRTPLKSVKLIDDNNKINELTNMAIVFNGVRSKKFSKSSYGYGYNNKYGKNRKRKNLTRVAG